MRASLLIKYLPDTLVVTVLATAAAASGIFAHGATKGYTPEIAAFGTVLFTVTMFALFAAAAAGRRLPRSALVKRLLIGLAVAAVVVPAAFLEVEALFAPAELAAQTPVTAVVARIATDADLPQLKAWARLRTMSKDEQEQVARALAPLLIGTDDRARHSAELTLDVALRRHSVATLVALAPVLKGYFAARAPGPAGGGADGARTPEQPGTRAAAYSRRFVELNAGSVRRALEATNRQLLPEGGVEALLLTLATDDGIGRQLLQAYANGAGDQDLKPLAAAALKTASGAAPAS